MGDNQVSEELARLRSQLSAIEELLAVHEQAVLAQSDKLEAAMHELKERQVELENLTVELALARDQALAASQLKSQFLANVSHEIRTPISTVIGMAELLLDADMMATDKRLVGILNDAAQSLLSIINDILDLSKIEAGKIELSIGDFCPRELAEGALAMFEAEAECKGLRLRLAPDARLPARLCGDAQRLRQIFQNLLSNAIKFTAEGEVELKLELASSTADAACVRISVRDTGIGIAEDALKQVFEPFVQIDSTSTRRTGGTGLGLSISQDLVRLMGGELTVVSSAGKGSTFAFTLTLALPEDVAEVDTAAPEEKTAGPRPQPAGGAAATTTRVLVVEDNPTLQELAVRQLRKLGYQAQAVSNGEEAVTAVLSGGVDVVLMDCQMPELDGFAATRRIRDRERLLGLHTPIVAMTASALASDREICLSAGMDDYMSKPVRMADLKVMVDRWAGRKQ